MFKDVLIHADLSHWAEAGLVIFFVIFVGAMIWTLTRPRRMVEEWARLPLHDSHPELGDNNDE
jgi:hypothetical protein